MNFLSNCQTSPILRGLKIVIAQAEVLRRGGAGCCSLGNLGAVFKAERLSSARGGGWVEKQIPLLGVRLMCEKLERKKKIYSTQASDFDRFSRRTEGDSNWVWVEGGMSPTNGKRINENDGKIRRIIRAEGCCDDEGVEKWGGRASLPLSSHGRPDFYFDRVYPFSWTFSVFFFSVAVEFFLGQWNFYEV